MIWRCLDQNPGTVATPSRCDHADEDRDASKNDRGCRSESPAQASAAS